MTAYPALITGASRGLGAAFARALSSKFHIIAVARTVGGLEELDDSIKKRGGVATLVPIDINNDKAIATLCRAIYERWGGISLWIHSAIYAPPLSPASHIDDKDFTATFETNVLATQRLITMLAPLLRPDSTAVFFEDMGAKGSFFGTYGASKAAQMALVKSWAAEAAKIGPKILTLSPQPMATAMRARFYPGEDRQTIATPESEATRLLDETDLGAPCTPP